MRSCLLFLFLFFSLFINSKVEKIIEENCASCHENKSLNLISIASMSQYSEEDLLRILEVGKMKSQARGLSEDEKKSIAKYLAKQNQSYVDTNYSNSCERQLSISNFKKGSKWTSWGFDSSNTRYQPESNIDSSNLKKLKLKWSFGLNETDTRGQPIAVGGVIFVSGKSLHALDKETGCSFWSFQPKSNAVFRNSPVFDGAKEDAIYIVDSNFIVYKLNILNGTVVWKTKINKEFESNTSSASPTLAGNLLFVPISTYETVLAIDPNYECCKSSGGMIAINSENGEIIWNHRIEERAQFTKKGLITRTKKYAPAGSAVWNSPSIDLQEGKVFFGTGQSLQSPASKNSDSIISLDINSGEKVWVTQTLSGDAYNVGCEIPIVRSMVCPEEKGPDFDFGASVIQTTDLDGNKILLAGQKSGWVFKLNPLTGEIDWKKKVGNGGLLGGIHFGMATDNKKLYVPISDRWVNRDYDKKAKPGLYALDFLKGEIIWSFIPKNICSERKPLYGEGNCFLGYSAPISVTNDILFAGSLDGTLSAHSVMSGNKLWEFDTLQAYETVNKIPAIGGSMDVAGPVIVDNWLFVTSGYAQHGQMTGNVILAFSID